MSSGHRNVQGLDWEPGSDRLVITEFGPDSDDEVNVIRKGGNYGWPEAQGDEGAPEFEEPVVNYEDVIAPSGATFVRDEGLGLDRQLRVRRAASASSCAA